MKVYVDELPKSCSQCVCCDTDKWCNAFSVYTENPETKKNCPLKSLAEHDKQVRKEICDKIRENAISHNNLEVDMYYITPQQLYEIEQGETNEI